ncbi:MAG: TetR/AcrR family transcriptional regulator [Acidimicrobiia bacterium]|nr:TetR/AcrR family transcriptional regulator [Acidimicrobiia bacterium]
MPLSRRSPTRKPPAGSRTRTQPRPAAGRSAPPWRTTGVRPRKHRIGRPRRRPAHEPSTRERLLSAAARALIDTGYEAATVQAIAADAGVTSAAVYTHFKDRTDLLYQSARWSIDAAVAHMFERMREAPHTWTGLAHVLAADDLADIRRLFIAIHLAASRHPVLAEFVAGWHRDAIEEWRRRPEGIDLPLASIKARFLILLGICLLDSMGSIDVPKDELVSALDNALRASLPVNHPAR